jgi:hypothetical protein
MTREVKLRHGNGTLATVRRRTNVIRNIATKKAARSRSHFGSKAPPENPARQSLGFVFEVILLSHQTRLAGHLFSDFAEKLGNDSLERVRTRRQGNEQAQRFHDAVLARTRKLSLSDVRNFHCFRVSFTAVEHFQTCLSGLIKRKTVFIGMSFRPVAGQLVLPSRVMTLLLLSPLPSLVNIEVCVSLIHTLLNVCFVLSKPNKVVQ